MKQLITTAAELITRSIANFLMPAVKRQNFIRLSAGWMIAPNPFIQIDSFVLQQSAVATFETLARPSSYSLLGETT